MKSLPKPDVIFTHESDLDGLVAGVLLQRLARRMFNADVRLEAWHYNAWKQRDLREATAWVTDFTFESRLDKANWLIVDHHVTEAQPKTAMLVHDINKSAGLLCYELCQQNGISSPALDRLVKAGQSGQLMRDSSLRRRPQRDITATCTTPSLRRS